MGTPGQPYALQVIHPGSPILRIRYRHGILLDPYGRPDWLLYARALVRIGPPEAGRAVQRPLDALAANEAMARAGDALWDRHSYVAGTPAGWVWTLLARPTDDDRCLALVPADLHGSFRHAGEYRSLPAGPAAALTDAQSHPARWRPSQLVPEHVLLALEAQLGHRLPPAYRQFLGHTNGGAPDQPVVPETGGFVVDQPWFGVGATDRHQDLLYVNAWLRDRFSPRFLALGWVQGGLLVVDVTDDSVWFWDDDDPQARQEDGPTDIESRLVRCGDTVDGLLATLATPGASLLRAVDAMVDTGDVVPLREDLAGTCLPPRMRPPWQPGLDKAAAADPLAKLLDNPPLAAGMPRAHLTRPAPAVDPAPVPAAPPAPPTVEGGPWRPANEVEAAMAQALAAGDQRRYADVLASAVLYLPAFVSDAQRMITWQVADRPHLLVFTSVPAMVATLDSSNLATGGGPDSYRTTDLAELTSKWADPSCRLAVDPHLPIGAVLDVGAVALLRSGQLRLTSLGDLVEEAAQSEPVPVDPVEAALDRALDDGRAEAFLATLRGATAYLPVDDTGEWVAVPVDDGTVHIVAFTSAERCAQWLPEDFVDAEMFEIAMTDLARDWPGPQFRLSLNPGTPVAAILEAAEVGRILDG